MKKLLTLILVVLFAFTLVGCNDTKSTLAINIENNVNRLTKLLDADKEINEEDILIKELNNNYVASNVNSVNKNKNKTNTRIVKDQEFENKNIVDLNNKIQNMPRVEGNTQIVKNEQTAKTTEKQEILKAGNRAVKNMTSSGTPSIKRLTTGSYTPRKIQNVNYDNSGLKNYISKIEDLYLMMNDAACANKDCNNLESAIKENCNMLKGLCGQLKNNKIQLNNGQIQACNDLLAGLNKNTNTLNSTKNDLKTECNSVKKMNINPSANLEQISTKYIKLINCLDEKITCYSNILSLLTQLKCTITGVCESDNIEKNVSVDEKSQSTEIPLENIPRTLPYFPEEDEKLYEKTNKLNEESKNQKLKTENRQLKRNKKYPTSRDKDESITLNNTEKVADFNTNTKRKNNLDSFKDSTITPNIGNNKNLNNKTDNKNEKNNENNNSQKNESLPNNNLNNNANNTLINGTNNVPIVNGLNPAVNGINPAVNGVGNGAITNGYIPHNYENGITNPYRNTDTYKFPLGNKVNNGMYNNGAYPAITKMAPLPEETRQNFKTFN